MSNVLDWTIFLAVVLTVVIAGLFSRNYRVTLRRRKSRELTAQIISKRPSSYEYIPAAPTAIAGLDLKQLEELTQSLRALGFRALADVQLLGTGEKTPHSFGRTFVNEEAHCFAEVMAIQKVLDERGEPIIGLNSFLEEGWSVNSSNGARSLQASYFRRLPRAVKMFTPEFPLPEMYERHLELRDRIVSDLGIGVQEDTSLEFYRRETARRLAKGTEAFLARDVLGEWHEANEIQKEGHWEWLGDYPQELVKRAKGRKLRVIPDNFPTYEVPRKDAVEQLTATQDEASQSDKDE